MNDPVVAAADPTWLAWAKDNSWIVTLLFSSTALGLSFLSYRVAKTSAFATQILKHVEEEMAFALSDRRTYRVICTTPHEPLSSKLDLVKQLHENRDASRKRIDQLEAMLGKKVVGALRQARSAMEDDDTYIGNRECRLKDGDGERLACAHETRSESYSEHLRAFTKRVNKRKW